MCSSDLASSGISAALPLSEISASSFCSASKKANIGRYTMKQLLYSFFKDEAFAKKFKCVSAAKTVHHGFAGGLLEHSLSVTRLCDKMSSNYDFLNRDLLITCAMLHDVGKVKELSEFPKNDYTDEGNFLGHIVIGYEMVMEKVKQIDGFPDMLAMQIGHCILSHHGEPWSH